MSRLKRRFRKLYDKEYRRCVKMYKGHLDNIVPTQENRESKKFLFIRVDDEFGDVEGADTINDKQYLDGSWMFLRAVLDGETVWERHKAVAEVLAERSENQRLTLVSFKEQEPLKYSDIVGRTPFTSFF